MQKIRRKDNGGKKSVSKDWDKLNQALEGELGHVRRWRKPENEEKQEELHILQPWETELFRNNWLQVWRQSGQR